MYRASCVNNKIRDDVAVILEERVELYRQNFLTWLQRCKNFVSGAHFYHRLTISGLKEGNVLCSCPLSLPVTISIFYSCGGLKLRHTAPCLHFGCHICGVAVDEYCYFESYQDPLVSDLNSSDWSFAPYANSEYDVYNCMLQEDVCELNRMLFSKIDHHACQDEGGVYVFPWYKWRAPNLEVP